MNKPTKDIREKLNTYDIVKYIGLLLGSTMAIIACAINILFVSSNDNRSTLHIVLVASTNAVAIALGILAIVFFILSHRLKAELAIRRAEAYKRMRQHYRRREEHKNHAETEEKNEAPELDVEVIDDEDLITGDEEKEKTE